MSDRNLLTLHLYMIIMQKSKKVRVRNSYRKKRKFLRETKLKADYLTTAPCFEKHSKGYIHTLVQLSSTQWKRISNSSIHISGKNTVNGNVMYSTVEYGKHIVKKKKRKRSLEKRYGGQRCVYKRWSSASSISLLTWVI